MYARTPCAIVAVAAVFVAVACSSKGAETPEAKTGGEFYVTDTEPRSGGTIHLNEPVRIEFSQPVDFESASLTTVSFVAMDATGQEVPELVTGNFHLDDDGHALLFAPKLPSNEAFDNGGFKPDRQYVVHLVGGDAHNGTTVMDRRGRGMDAPFALSFRTVAGTSPSQLFANPKPGGPVRVGLEVTTAMDLELVPLALLGAPPLEVRLHFDQALNPLRSNIPVGIATDPLLRKETDKGGVFLEYQDPELDPIAGDYTWIPAAVELERNDITGAILVLRPIGVLPNNAEVRVIVEPGVEDIAGEANLDRPGYDRVFGRFRTVADHGQQWDAIVESFDDTHGIDLGAVFPESQAETGPGWLRAGFAFEGSSVQRDYHPTTNEVVLNTAFTQIVPANGLPFSVNGGVFQFRDVTIPQGVRVIGQGPNPMVWLCSGKFTVSGTLTVGGGDGARVDTLNSANVAKAGGIGICTGGNGGDGTPSATRRDLRGGTGRGPLQEFGKGGRGGLFACEANCYTGNGYQDSGGGSGGGGGAMATQGDPNWLGAVPATAPQPNAPTPLTATSFQQWLGFGGAGCSNLNNAANGSGNRSGFLRGGEPGDLVFRDTRTNNDYWGSAIDFASNLRIAGELAVPVGGGGGGGGGDTASVPNPTCNPNEGQFISDYSGGGGGGGGGVLVVKALGEIWITSTGRLDADGGNGGGGEQVGGCGEAGGGGGGAGGMVILMSAKGIRIEAHGNASLPTPRFVYSAPAGAPFAGNDYTFAISADGGICRTGGFEGPSIPEKYPLNGGTMLPGTTYDENPTGGLGGLGVVQLMVPPGDNSDGTNTRLDDNIHFHMPGGLSSATPTMKIEIAAQKQQLLAWRGFPNASGVPVDDNGIATNIGKHEGDIRPSPVLLPVPFGAKSRARSPWLDTGRSQRRPLATPDGQARAIVVGAGVEVGPRYEFAGLQADGYVAWSALDTAGVRIEQPVRITPTALASVSADATYLGEPAYRVRLQQPALGNLANRYAQHEAELQNAGGARLASFRILSHTADELVVDPGRELLPEGATQLRVVAKFFGITTRDVDGLPHRVPLGASSAVPTASVRIGFAFHTDPTTAGGVRFPEGAQQFVHDLDHADVQEWLLSNRPRYVMWDVTFDLTYDAGIGAVQTLRPDVGRPTLQFLRLPVRW